MADYKILLCVVVEAQHDVEAQQKAIPSGAELYDIKSVEQLEPWAARQQYHRMHRHPSRRISTLW